MTDPVANIYTALCAAQSEFGKVQKGSTNPAFKSKYADLADVCSVVIPTLSSHGVAVLHYVVRDSEHTAMRTEFVHGETGTKVWCDIPLIVDRNNMQGMKSATTYAKRIGLESLSGVAPEDDDGNAAAKAAPRQEHGRDNTPPPAEKPAPRDPVKIADFICGQIGKLITLDQANAYPGKGKAADAWEWLAIEAPEQAARCDAALATKKDELAEAPF